MGIRPTENLQVRGVCGGHVHQDSPSFSPQPSSFHGDLEGLMGKITNVDLILAKIQHTLR